MLKKSNSIDELCFKNNIIILSTDNILSGNINNEYKIILIYNEYITKDKFDILCDKLNELKYLNKVCYIYCEFNFSLFECIKKINNASKMPVILWSKFTTLDIDFSEIDNYLNAIDDLIWNFNFYFNLEYRENISILIKCLDKNSEDYIDGELDLKIIGNTEFNYVTYLLLYLKDEETNKQILKKINCIIGDLGFCRLFTDDNNIINYIKYCIFKLLENSRLQFEIIENIDFLQFLFEKHSIDLFLKFSKYQNITSTETIPYILLNNIQDILLN